MVQQHNSNGLRKRHTSLQNDSLTTQNDSEPTRQAGQSGKEELGTPQVFNDTLRLWQQRGLVLVHFCAVLWMVWGFVIKAKFHTGTECDMTYSRYQFFPVPVKTKTSYQLYKFMDRGDPRHGNNQHLQKDWCGVGDSDNPLSKRNIVLYVPGHWGSHSQARSIGAHGIQMTGARTPHVYMQKAAQALQTGQWNGQATTESSFIFDVYAADFLEQGTALHGKFLLEQTEFVAEAVSTLAQKCEVSSITILAHSVGGLVARAVPILHPETRPILQNIITLATPHSGLPYVVEQRVHDFFSILAENQTSKMLEDTLVVSISGGLRDELIPPEVCDVSKVVPHGISVLATDIIPPKKDKDFGRPRFGMDHKCIVWCRGVLSVARKIIFAVSDTHKRERNASERLEQIQNLLKMNTSSDFSDAYQVRVKKMKSDFEEVNGFFGSVAVESAMVYHSELWISLYAIVGALHIALSCVSGIRLQSAIAFVIPFAAAGMGSMWSDRENLRFISVLLLSFVGHALYLIIRGVLEFGTKSVKSTTAYKAIPLGALSRMLVTRLWVAWLAPIILIQMSLQVVSSVLFAHQHDLLRNLLDHPVAVAFVWTVVFLLGLAIWSLTTYGMKDNNSFQGKINQKRQKMSFVALVLPIVPCLSVGKIMFIVWGLLRDDHYLSLRHGNFGTMEEDLVKFLLLVILPLGIRLVLYSLPTIEPTDFAQANHATAAHSGVTLPTRKSQQVRIFVYVGLIFYYGPRMFMVGKGYVVGGFLAGLAVFDIAFVIYETMQKI